MVEAGSVREGGQTERKGQIKRFVCEERTMGDKRVRKKQMRERVR